MIRLGIAFEQGLGVEADLGEARYWLDRAAKSGDREAAALLLEFDARHGGKRD